MTHGGEPQAGDGKGGANSVSPGLGGRLTLVGALNIVMAARALIAVLAVALAFVTGVVLLVQHRTWTSASSFMPQSRQPTSSLSGLAAQFGLYVPGADAGESPAFYADLLTNRAILGAAVDSQYTFRSDSGAVTMTLIQLYGKGPKDPALQREAAIRKLGKLVSANVSLKTGVVELAVTTRWPDLSRAINRRLLDLVNEFNMVKRQTQAAAERRFAEQQAQEAKDSLTAAENRYEAFLLTNRDTRSPDLKFEEDRLSRATVLRQQLYTTLMQAYEQAKIEQVRDTPVITVVQQPESPVRPDPRGAARGGILGLLAGGLLGLIIAFARHAFTGAAGDADELERFAALRDDLMADLRHPLRASTEGLSKLLGRG